jgi:hypothetical protein
VDPCHHGLSVAQRDNESPKLQEIFMGGTGLEPVTPSLSSWCSPN